jgi:glycosyltransferase involved in cell wall biosynthesis
MAPLPPATPSKDATRPRLVFIANTMYSSVLSGGDIHTLKMAESALRAGYRVHFFCGHALKAELDKRSMPVSLTVTDQGMMSPRDFGKLSSQIALLMSHLGRMRGTMRHLGEIQPDDIVYINTDLWWDVAPGMRSPARRKLMILGMDCPTLWEVARRSRPDVDTLRLASLHYWWSQNRSLRVFHQCSKKRLLYVHPSQQARLLRKGYVGDELVFVSNGMDLQCAESVPPQPKLYDAVWTGRIHKQKGVEDLIATVGYLARQIPDFRVVIVGNVKQALGPRFDALGVSGNVEFSGFVSEAEKFRLLKSSRVFLMPSRYESWGIVIAEALACGLPAVAFELAAYRPVFGDLVRYVKPFDTAAFQQAAAEEIRKARSGAGVLDPAKLGQFKRENSWERAGQRFLSAVMELEAH